MKTKLKSKKWKSLVSGILLAASASSFLIAPVFAAEYTDPLTGVVDDDLDIFGDDGNTVKLDKATNTITYDFQGQDHTFTVENDDGITASQGDKYSYIFNNVGADGSKGTLHIYQSNNQWNPYAGVNGFIASGGKITVNSNLDITATSDYASVGVAVANGADLVINGNVKMRKDDPSNPWGIITKNVHGNVGPGGAVSMDNGYDANYTGARWQPSAFSVGYTRGNITVNGDVDVAVRGTAVNVGAYNAAEGVHPYDLATVSLVGDSTRIITPYREKNSVEGFGEFIEPYYSLACYGGTINVNVKNMEAQKGKVEIVGNIMAMKRSEYTHTSDVYQDSRINLALTTADSSWKGIIDNANMTKSLVQTNPNDKNSYKYDPKADPVYADHSGEVNLWLQNGAQWIYENASRKDGLDYSHMPLYSQPSYGNYDGMSHLSRLVGGKDSASAGIIRVNDSDPIQIAEAEGVTKVWYEHADATPGTIIGGDVKVLNAKTGTEMMLYTGNNGISKGFAEGDTAAEKNNVSEVLNSLAHKLWYMAGDSNLTGSVSIAEGLTASSVTMKTGNITFAEGGQGFYDYTPEKDDKTYATGPIVKSENIGETRESDINGVVSVNVTEAQNGVSGNAPSAMYAAGDAVSPLVIDLQGHTLKLNANNQTANYVSTVYVDENKSMEIKDSKGNGVLKVSAGLGADGNADTKAKYVYGIRVGEGGNLTANTDVEIDGVKSSATQRAYGVYVSTKGNVVFEKDLSIKNVQTGNKVGPNTAGIYADSSSSADAPINITVKGNLNIENVLGSAIRALNTSTVSTAGATIKAADMSNGTDYSQYYALQANKGTINLNTGEGITAGILDVTGDMKVTDNKASVINVNMTKGSQWTGAVSNIPGSTYNAPAGQFNLAMAEGSVWNHETGRSVDTLKTTFAGSNVSKLDGSGVIYQNSDKGITVYDYSGDTTVVYGHDADNPQNITGGDFTVKTAADGSKITLVTDSQGINAGFEANDTAAEKNNVKEVLNKLANKLFYTGYKDANLAGVVKIADGLTASSVSAIVKASGDITFSDGSNGTKKAGQGFYDYTPEEDKPDYKTGAITKSENISLNREVDDKGVAHINVTESNAGNNKFASAIYAGEETSPSKPMTVNMSGKGLALNVAQTGGQAAAIYAGANTYIKVINPSADQKLSIRATNTDTKGSHGIYALGNAHLNISGPVEITDITTKGDAATGINIQGQQSEINIDGPLTISNVKGLRERGKGMSASGILVTGDSSTVTVSGPVDISGVRGSGIKLVGANTKVSVGGGTITAAEDSDKSHNFYAVRVDKGTLDINMKDGAAGDTTTKITGDMYATGQYGKKVVEYTGGELIDWKDAGILNVALTDKDSFWKGVAAYDQYNDDYGSGGNTAHDIGQFNLYLQNGATWTNEQQSHVTTTTIAAKNPVWAGSTLATLHGGKDAANAGHIFQNDSNNLTIVNYSGNTNIYYAHEGNGEAAENYKAGDTIIKSAAAGSEVSLITDNVGITMSNDGSVANVLNALAGKLTYSNFATGEKNLVGVVKIADGLTASSTALRTEKISFNEEGKGFYGTPEEADMAFTTTLTGSASSDAEYVKAGVIQTDGSYKFAKDASITMAKGAIAISLSKATLINAENNKLNLSTEGSVSGKVNAIKHNIDGALTINAGELNVTAVNNQEFGGVRAIEINSDNKSVKPNAVINAKVNVKAEANNGNAYGLYSENGSTLTVNNDVVMNSGNEDEWAVNGKVYNNGLLLNSSAALFVKGGKATELNVNGNVNLAVNAHGLLASGEQGVINVNGGSITVNKATNGLYAIAALDKGTVNMNVTNGAAGANNVNINGNIGVIAGMMGSIGMSTADVNLGLGTDKSVLNGVIYNSFDSEDGKANLYLQNGATWNNASWGNIINDEESLAFTGSHVTKFVGGSDAVHAGHIFQNDTKKLTIDNYSGNTNIYYAHEGNGEAAADYKAGDTVIKSAAAGSSVSLITDNKNVDMTDNNSVGSVLNALAGKLTYSNFATGEKNLVGYVKIAEGLTSSSAAITTGDISFDKAGKGFYDYTPEDSSYMIDPITGNLDKKYVKFGIETEKGIYNFTQDTVINVTKGDYSSNLSAIESSGGPITINADGKNLDVSYHVLKGSNVARAVATGLSYGKSKDITIKAKSLKLSTDTTGFYGQGVYATGGKITIDADTTISTSAQTESNGIYSGSGGTVTMNGNLDIQKDSNAANYIALKSDDNGIINVNVQDGKAGAGIVKIDGDVYTKSAETYDYWEEETTSTSSTVNLALQGKDSSWNGRSLYEVTSGDDSTSYGTFNLWLADGATWTNEKNGKEVPSGFTGSHVTNFTGGSDAAHAGNIFQNDTKNITFDNYSGNTNIYYAHTGNGEAAGDYKAGDTIIKHAEKDSVVSLITDNSGVNMSSADSIVNVLNSLAGKLTYSNFTKDENNLTGYVKIADGLTSSSAAMYTGDMAFSKKDGKGSLKDEDSIRPDLPAPDHQIKNEFTTTLTGVKAKDKEYYKAGVIKEEGLYQFTQNSSITTTNAHGADMNQATTIDAKGKTLTFNTNVTDNSTIHAIGANSTDGVTITADKLVLNAHSTKGRVEGINVGGQGQQNKDNPMKLTINGDTEMNIKGVGYTLGLYAAGNSEVTFNGNVTAMGDENSEWGLTSEKGAYGYYGCSLVYSGSNYTLQMGPKVTINGDVNAKIDGNCLFANGGHAKLTINGGGNIEINKDNTHNYYAMIAESGTTSMNVNLDANYDAISARDNKLVLKGNVGASTGAMNANEPELYTKVNLGLATADSVWTGIAYNGFKDEGNSAYGSDKKFYGAINVFLQNGATWNNEQWGAAVKGFKGSHVAKFVGGSDAAHAGNIFQNDANNITIDNYSGNTNIFYAHTGNGEAASDYAAGDTIIRSAAEGSVVSMITDNSGINMDNEYSVTDVLNTLAGKLTYSNFTKGEKNLAGYVKIADGLTASSAAMQTGNIAFNADTGKGSLENGSMKPGFTYPETQKPEATEKNQGITGDAKTDYQYKKDGILKEDGTYVFTQDPTKIEVESGAAVDATDKDINIDSTQAKLELKGETGINANGADVTVNGNTGISGDVGINAENGNVTLNGSTDIAGTDAAINAGEGGNVDINSNNGALNIKGEINASHGGNITIDSSNGTGTIEGNVTASNGGNVEITLDDANSQITGSYNVDDDSSIVMNIKNGAVWNLTDDDDEAAGMSLLRMAKAPAAAAAKGLTINGGESKAKTGYLNMTKRTKNLNIASYSGWETIIYGHENAGDKDEDYKSGDTIINKAAKDSGVILSTDNSGINMNDKAAVEATLKALAHKLTYNDHKANGSNLTGKVQIADGLTASSASKYLGNMRWDENGKGQYVDNSVNWKEIYNGNYETLVMQGVRSAATTSMHSWRDNMQDTYTGADLADADGIFAKALGGKTSSDVKGVKDDNTYRGVQVGLDKALANGWHAGVAFDYRNGDSNYLLGGKGDNQLYSFGVYGVKNFEDQSYLRVAAKAGRVENEYDVYNEIRSLKLHGDYKANAYGLTMEYGKTFGTEASYFTPKAQLTWSQVGAKDYTAHTPNDSMRIDQDAYSSLVARFGVEAGAKSEKGRVYVGLYGAHEFNGDITASYFAKDGGYKHTSFDGSDTWMEMSIGGSYDLSDNCHIYADFAKDFGGDFERKWKASAGLRFEF